MDFNFSQLLKDFGIGTVSVLAGLALLYHWLKDGAPFKFLFTRVSRKIEILRANLNDEHTPDYLKANLQQELDGWLFYQTYGFLPKNQKLCQALADFKADTQFSDLEFKLVGDLIVLDEQKKLSLDLSRLPSVWWRWFFCILGLFGMVWGSDELRNVIYSTVKETSIWYFFIPFSGGCVCLFVAAWMSEMIRSAEKLKAALIAYYSV